MLVSSQVYWGTRRTGMVNNQLSSTHLGSRLLSLSPGRLTLDILFLNANCVQIPWKKFLELRGSEAYLTLPGGGVLSCRRTGSSVGHLALSLSKSLLVLGNPRLQRTELSAISPCCPALCGTPDTWVPPPLSLRPVLSFPQPTYLRPLSSALEDLWTLLTSPASFLPPLPLLPS